MSNRDLQSPVPYERQPSSGGNTERASSMAKAASSGFKLSGAGASTGNILGYNKNIAINHFRVGIVNINKNAND